MRILVAEDERNLNRILTEALTDEGFANMLHEAEKYLGYPYV